MHERGAPVARRISPGAPGRRPKFRTSAAVGTSASGGGSSKAQPATNEDPPQKYAENQQGRCARRRGLNWVIRAQSVPRHGPQGISYSPDSATNQKSFDGSRRHRYSTVLDVENRRRGETALAARWRAINSTHAALRPRIGDGSTEACHSRRAIELDPTSAHAHDNLATVFSEQGEYLLALGEYLEALRLEPDSPITGALQPRLLLVLDGARHGDRRMSRPSTARVRLP